MIEKFYADCKRFIYEAGNGSPVADTSLDQSKDYDVREFKLGTMIRSQSGSGKELNEALGIKPVASKPVEKVEVVKEKTRKTLLGRKK